MKRFLIATALTATLSSAAFAATEAEVTQIESYVPGVNAEALSDSEVAEAMAVIAGSESRSAKMGKLSAMLGVEMTNSSVAMPTEAQASEIQRYVSDVDYAMVTQAQLDTAMSYIQSEMSPSDIEARVTSVLTTDATPVGVANTASAAESAMLQRYLPEVKIDALTETQLNSALAVVYGGGSDTEIMGKLEAMVR
ncbi:hypothetical protein [Puniceibacterium confluentis]|uniref:hypothetical protein n=1 Tax=Puniceibacterium confluentis TaxID=1958944 RepID=UPI0011B79314|nr:hypothetical protein [Puniceibacterium confluentis]